MQILIECLMKTSVQQWGNLGTWKMSEGDSHVTASWVTQAIKRSGQISKSFLLRKRRRQTKFWQPVFSKILKSAGLTMTEPSMTPCSVGGRTDKKASIQPCRLQLSLIQDSKPWCLFQVKNPGLPSKKESSSS